MADLLNPNEMMFQNWEPKVSNRFIMSVEGIPAFLIKASGRPNVSFGDIVIDHMNVKRKLKGKAEWADITMTLYDPIVPSGAQAVIEWIRLSHESVTGRDGYADFYKKDITIDVLGPVGDKVEQWVLKGAFISSANFGTLDWATDGIVNIEVTLKMDYAILNY